MADGVVYVGGESGVMEALDAATGAVRWKQTVKVGRLRARGCRGAVYVTTEKGSVYALRASDGALRGNLTMAA